MSRLAILLAAAAAVALLALARHREEPARAARAAPPRTDPPLLPDLAAQVPDAPVAPAEGADAPPAAGSQEDLPALLALLDTDAPRRERIVRRIARIGGDEAWACLVARLDDPALRTSIEIALGRLAPPEVIEALKRKMLAAPAPAPRASIARILASTADSAHGKDIRALLDRECDASVRHAAIGALGQFGDRDSADALVELMRLGGRDAGTALFAFLEIDREETLQGVAARWPGLCTEARLCILQGSEQPSGAILAAAREALADRDERLRLAAIGLLSRASDEGVEPLLDHALRGSGDEAERTVRALLDLATARAAEAGLRALETLPPSRRKHYRAEFLAVLGR